MMLKQTAPYGCGIYSVANALNKPDFATAHRLEESKKGTRVFQLNDYLDKDGHEFVIEPMFYSDYSLSLPVTTHNLCTFKEDTYLPILLCVRHSKKSLNHMVGGLIGTDKTLILMDSMKPEPIITTIEDVQWEYSAVFGLYTFYSIHSNSDVVYMKGLPDYLQNIIDNKKP